MKIFLIIKEKIGLIIYSILWLCIWATYNTDIFRIFEQGFPYRFFDLIHVLRSIFPFVALIIAIIILIKNSKFNGNLFKGPLGLLLIYSLIGIFASFFSKNQIGSLYWGTLYFSLIIVLFAVLSEQFSAKKIYSLIKI